MEAPLAAPAPVAASAPPPPVAQSAPSLVVHPSSLLSRRLFVRLDSKDKEPPVVSYKKLVRDAEEAGRQRSADGAAPGVAITKPLDADTAVHGAQQRPLATAMSLGDDADAGDGPDEEEDEAPAGDADEDDGDSQDGDDSGSRSSGKDAGDWYDLDDGFIDDSELLDAPEEDAGKAKHNGFFINKGEIEREKQLVPLPDFSPGDPTKKRKKQLHAAEGGTAKHAKYAQAMEVAAAHAFGAPGQPGGVSPGGGPSSASEQLRFCEAKKPKAAPVMFQNTGLLGDAIRELQEIVKNTPLPSADQQRKFLTPAMQEGLQKVQRIISVHAELPRGLTAKLMEFMEPFAGIATLRRRLGQDRDELPATGAPAPPSAVAVALQQQTQPSGAAAGPKRPVPSAAQMQDDLARLRACVAARCALLKSSGAGGEGELPASGSADGDEFAADESFKWDRECEEALHAVVVNTIATGTSGQHKSVFKDLAARDIWPAGMVDAKALKLAHTRVIKRQVRASCAASGKMNGGGAEAGQSADAAQPAAAALPL